MMKNEWFKDIGKSIAIGLLLFFSAVLYLMLKKDMIHLHIFSENVIWLMGGYVVGVIGIQCICSMKSIKKLEVLFQGEAIAWWILLGSLLWMDIISLMPDYIRGIAFANACVIVCILVGTYIEVYFISKELNREDWKRGFVIVEDLSSKPRNEEEFFKSIQCYCKKNALELEVLDYGMPAKIKMGGLIYEADVMEYCSLSDGIAYALRFRVD